jgi:membrane associated rhomboid family serine protease
MFPLGDDNTSVTTPAIVTIILIVANVIVFVLFQGMGSNERFTYSLSTVPQEIVTGKDIDQPVRIIDPITKNPGESINLERTPVPVYLTLLTSMFMHGGWMHLLGNMWFLWIFGDNLEHVMGHLKFLFFYLICGVAAGLAHVITTTSFGGNPFIPTLGASGAISGVLGGYIVLFPTSRVRVIMMRIITDVPAYVALGIWFVFQLISGMGILGDDSQSGGVAYAAHVGGFAAGLLLVKLFATNVPERSGN